MNNSQQNKVLLAEVKKTLDQEEKLLTFPIQSKLTQARFHAIDHGFLNSNHHRYNKKFALTRLGAASALAVTLVTLISFLGIYSSPENMSFKGMLISPVPIIHNQIETVISSSKDTEDTEEEVDIYHWLYDHYG